MCGVQAVICLTGGGVLAADVLHDAHAPPEGFDAASAGSTAAILAKGVVGQLEPVLSSGACVDEHTTDQILVFMALAQGRSTVRCRSAASWTSQHIPTAMALLEQVTGCEFISTPDGDSHLIACEGAGLAIAPGTAEASERSESGDASERRGSGNGSAGAISIGISRT